MSKYLVMFVHTLQGCLSRFSHYNKRVALTHEPGARECYKTLRLCWSPSKATAF